MVITFVILIVANTIACIVNVISNMLLSVKTNNVYYIVISDEREISRIVCENTFSIAKIHTMLLKIVVYMF